MSLLSLLYQVVDVISGKPPRKSRDQEMVELSDSDSESEQEDERAGTSLSGQAQSSTAHQVTQSLISRLTLS